MKRRSAFLIVLSLGVALAIYGDQKAQDATKVAPDVYRIVFENEHVRVLEARLATGQKSPMHSHPARVAIYLSPAQSKLTLPDGRTVLQDQRPGDIHWQGPAEHSAEILAGSLHAVVVEVKSAQQPNRPQ